MSASRHVVTATQRHFVERYRAATLRGAVERAAEMEREAAGNPRGASGPVDVEQIACRRRIRIEEHADGAGCAEALLLPTREGFVVRLRKSGSAARRRWSIAHEVGHALFYREGRSGPEHEVGITAADEILAEERICNMFAGALLMPHSALKRLTSALPGDDVWNALDWLDRTARLLRVSVPTLVVRLGELQPNGPAYSFMYFRFRENSVTSTDPKLRVGAWSAIGQPRTTWVWRNRSAEGINIGSVTGLFDTWRRRLIDGKEPEGGRWTWLPDRGLVRAGTETCEVEELVRLSLTVQGRWRSADVPMRVASSLYAAPGATERDAYVVSALARV